MGRATVVFRDAGYSYDEILRAGAWLPGGDPIEVHLGLRIGSDVHFGKKKKKKVAEAQAVKVVVLLICLSLNFRDGLSATGRHAWGCLRNAHACSLTECW